MKKKIYGKIENWEEVRKKGKTRFFIATTVAPLAGLFVVYLLLSYIHSQRTGIPFGSHSVEKGVLIASLVFIPMAIHSYGVWQTNERELKKTKGL